MWAWCLLSQHPEVEAKLHEELDSVLGDTPPSLETFSRLKYTEQIFSEALRLFPPAYVIPRYALNTCQLGGYTIPQGALVLVSPYLISVTPATLTNPSVSNPNAGLLNLRPVCPKWPFFLLEVVPGCV